MLTKSIFLVSASQEIKHFIYNTKKKVSVLTPHDIWFFYLEISVILE
jgi:hypothetical protein